MRGFKLTRAIGPTSSRFSKALIHGPAFGDPW
jgi:hypothetical protein